MRSCQKSNEPYLIERIISAATYFTAGGVGFVWLIIAAFLRKKVTPFLMYHIMQSIFLSILFFLLVTFGNLLYVIICRIPIINIIPYLLNYPIAICFNMSIAQIFTSSVILYSIVTSFCGKYTYIPWVSDIIKSSFPSR